MTEEDTFNRLRRPSTREMTQIWFRSPLTIPGLWNPTCSVPVEVESFFSKHGWKFLEWWHAYDVMDDKLVWRDPGLDHD